jgi:hypothetical protein
MLLKFPISYVLLGLLSLLFVSLFLSLWFVRPVESMILEAYGFAPVYCWFWGMAFGFMDVIMIYPAGIWDPFGLSV